MSHRTQRRTVALTLLAALLAVLGWHAAPAQADDPVPTSTHLTMNGYLHGKPSTIVLTATVTSGSGTPTGSVTFSGTMATKTVPVGADGTAVTTVQTSGEDVEFFASFVGTNGYADSVAEKVYAYDPDRTVWHHQPTVARIGGPGLLQLTLTFATRITDRNGAPKANVPIHFTILNPQAAFLEPQKALALEICVATTDANGFATCKGKALLGAVVSIVTGGAYANLYQGFFPTGKYSKLPVIVTG